MFTGIIEEAGVLASLRKGDKSTDLTIHTRTLHEGVQTGESIAVNGVCLTAVQIALGSLTFNVLNETLRVTNLGEIGQGSWVNLERSLMSSSRLGGHFVTGHVDAVGRVQEWEKQGDDYRLLISAPEQIAQLCVNKGSIAVDGISLTVAEISGHEILIWIIPHTMQVTNMQGYAIGTSVNLEGDILGKYVQKFLAQRPL